MTKIDGSPHQLTPSQQELFDAILAHFSNIRGSHRPFLLTGDAGVGKSFLAARLTNSGAACWHIARDHLPYLLADRSLSDLTPEATVRFAKGLIKESQDSYAIVDGLEPLLSLWAAERPKVLPNFFVAFGRAILERPSLIVIQTSGQLPHDLIEREDWWPWERRFRLELTQADKETVAVNWGLDPMRAHVSANLYDLLAVKLER